MTADRDQAMERAARELEAGWASDGRWEGIERTYTAADVVRLRGSVQIEHTLARLGAQRLWALLHERDFVAALGVLTGGQAVQAVKAGLNAIYLSGWQVAADANLAEQVYPDQSLYPSNSVPAVARRINNALRRADQIAWAEGKDNTHWLAPIIADAEAGFGGLLNAFELMQAMIEAGAAGVHFEDQLSSEKKCGHLGGKVLIPTSHFVRTLMAARLAADVAGVPTVLIARTDALTATLLTSDVDERDREFLTGQRSVEGYFRVRAGLDPVLARCRAYAPYTDLLWFETSTPDLEDARRFAEAIHAEFPSKLLAYNFDKDFDVDDWHGTNAFVREGDRIFRTYVINARGDEQMGSTWNYLDITALGRQEEWEDSPEGYPQTPPYGWWNYHDAYSEGR
jgi:isocitrate lyase